MARAADLLGMEATPGRGDPRLAAWQLPGAGPAVSRDRDGEDRTVETSARRQPKLVPCRRRAADLQELVFARCRSRRPSRSPKPVPRRIPADELLADLARPAPAVDAVPDMPAADIEAVYTAVMRAIVEDPEAAMRPAAVLFQDFQVRCRMGGLAKPALDLPGFAKRLSCARAGIFDAGDGEWRDALELAGALPDDMLGAFLLVARAAREGEPCPTAGCAGTIARVWQAGRSTFYCPVCQR